jgi:hypothetical protein
MAIGCKSLYASLKPESTQEPRQQYEVPTVVKCQVASEGGYGIDMWVET